jgi:hypothetical protein
MCFEPSGFLTSAVEKTDKYGRRSVVPDKKKTTQMVVDAHASSGGGQTAGPGGQSAKAPLSNLIGHGDKCHPADSVNDLDLAELSRDLVLRPREYFETIARIQKVEEAEADVQNLLLEEERNVGRTFLDPALVREHQRHVLKAQGGC